VQASELIAKLQELVQQHGDLPVWHWDDYDFFDIEIAAQTADGEEGLPIVAFGIETPIESPPRP